jgi:hypothetical protein
MKRLDPGTVENMESTDPFAWLLQRQQEITEAYQQILLTQARFWDDYSSMLRAAARLQSSFLDWLAASTEFYRALIGVGKFGEREYQRRLRGVIDVPGA